MHLALEDVAIDGSETFAGALTHRSGRKVDEHPDVAYVDQHVALDATPRIRRKVEQRFEPVSELRDDVVDVSRPTGAFTCQPVGPIGAVAIEIRALVVE